MAPQIFLFLHWCLLQRLTGYHHGGNKYIRTPQFLAVKRQITMSYSAHCLEKKACTESDGSWGENPPKLRGALSVTQFLPFWRQTISVKRTNNSWQVQVSLHQSIRTHEEIRQSLWSETEAAMKAGSRQSAPTYHQKHQDFQLCLLSSYYIMWFLF